MVTTPTPEQMARYKRTARAVWLAEQNALDARRRRAWGLARHAASLLKERYGVARVVVFGSLSRDEGFSRWSDVDLAAWGLTGENWLQAIGAVHELADDIEINLVDVTCSSMELLALIEEEGVDL